MTMRGKMVHKFSDRADEQRKEAEVVRSARLQSRPFLTLTGIYFLGLFDVAAEAQRDGR
jgi:hypothetical protein